MPSATKTNPSKWKSIVSRVKAGTKGGDPGEWSARKAQLWRRNRETCLSDKK